MCSLNKASEKAGGMPTSEKQPRSNQTTEVTNTIHEHKKHEITMSESKSSSRPVSKRVSTAPAAPKPPATIDPSAILANHATLTGIFPITVGTNAVLNPYCKIISNAGPVEIGEGVVLWERSVVGINVDSSVREDEDEADSGGRFVMLERNCIIESGAQVAAKLVGEGTVIEAFANVGEGAVIGKFCTISPHVVIPPNAVIDDFTIMYGQSKRRKDITATTNPNVLELRQAAHQKQLKMLQALIPSNLAKWLA